MKVYRGRKALVTLFAGLVLFVLSGSVFGQNMFRKMNDFDGDGKSDFAVTRRENGAVIWYIWQSRDGFKAFQWGVSGDQIAPGDYDGDGKIDFAIWRGNNFPDPILVPRFWIWRSGSNSALQVDFPGAFNVRGTEQQDYDGDGKTDPALWIGNIQEPPGSSPTTVVTKNSTQGSSVFNIPSGSSPLHLGDMTGDRRADIAYFTGYQNITVTVPNAATSIQFGILNDQLVGPADFDGDGKGDLAVFRPSTGDWWWIRSSDGTARSANWGASGDVTVAADYDGDGKTDLAIWRVVSGQGYFWIYGSQNGTVTVFPWGLSTDQLVRAS